MFPGALPLILALAAFLGGAAGAAKLTSMHYLHVIDVAAQEAAAAVAEANTRAQGAAASYEATRAAQRTRTVTITREVEREVKSDPDCSTRPLPGGLRDALTAATADAGEPVADSAVPATAAASAGHVGRSGAGVR